MFFNRWTRLSTGIATVRSTSSVYVQVHPDGSCAPASLVSRHPLGHVTWECLSSHAWNLLEWLIPELVEHLQDTCAPNPLGGRDGKHPDGSPNQFKYSHSVLFRPTSWGVSPPFHP